MNGAGAGVWGRLRGWLEYDPPADRYVRLKRAPMASDETQKLQAFFTGGTLNADIADVAFQRVAHRIRASRILFVPSLWSGAALNVRRTKLVEYLTQLVRQLRDQGFGADIADIETGAGVAGNGERLAEILRVHHCPTWIVTHSKSGLDVLQTLVAFPEVRRFVEGWIAFQSPFFGSPVADVVCGNHRARIAGRAASRLLGVNPDTVCALRTDVRGQYMDEHAVEIAQAMNDVSVMCVQSTLQSLRWPTGRWLNELGLVNDGLVPATSMVLPGTRYVTFDGLGHGEVETRHMFSRRHVEQADLLKALFVLLLGGQPRKAAA